MQWTEKIVFALKTKTRRELFNALLVLTVGSLRAFYKHTIFGFFMPDMLSVFTRDSNYA